MSEFENAGPADPAEVAEPLVEEVEAEDEAPAFAGEDHGTDISGVGGAGHVIVSEGISVPEEIEEDEAEAGDSVEDEGEV